MKLTAQLQQQLTEAEEMVKTTAQKAKNTAERAVQMAKDAEQAKARQGVSQIAKEDAANEAHQKEQATD